MAGSAVLFIMSEVETPRIAVQPQAAMAANYQDIAMPHDPRSVKGSQTLARQAVSRRYFVWMQATFHIVYQARLNACADRKASIHSRGTSRSDVALGGSAPLLEGPCPLSHPLRDPRNKRLRPGINLPLGATEHSSRRVPSLYLLYCYWPALLLPCFRQASKQWRKSGRRGSRGCHRPVLCAVKS